MKERFRDRVLATKWHMSEAIKTGVQRLKHPLIRVESWNWGQYDHNHICLAARLLTTKDFLAVCPCHGSVGMIEVDDECDGCPYMAIIDFNTSKDGSKNISLSINEAIQT